MTSSTVTLLENAFLFINEGIRNSRRAKREHRYWSFAILHLIQGLELLLKQVLRDEHPILIYENVDSPKHTVSISQCLERLKSIAYLDIDEKEERLIRRAISQRNKILHHEYEVNPDHNRAVFVQLFEFAHYFYAKHFEDELHDHIDSTLLRTEAELLAQFDSDWVTYRGRSLPSKLPLDMVIAQRYTAIRLKHESGEYFFFKRSPYDGRLGDECPDCGVLSGEFHVGFCDIEQCPSCGHQLLMCIATEQGCDVDYWIPRKGEQYCETRAKQHVAGDI